MKETIYIKIICLLLLVMTACSQEELPNGEEGSGYLSLNVAISEAQEKMVYTKAVEMPEVELKVEIWQNGAVYDNHSYTLTTVPAKIPLEKGNYTLTIYNDVAKSADKNSGPRYEYSQDFTIEENKTTDLKTIKMKMQNFAIGLSLPDGFDDWFTDYTFTLSVGDVTKTLRSGEIAYFDMDDTLQNFTYQLKATNHDREEMTSDGAYLKNNTGLSVLSANTIYTINYSLETQSFQVE